MSQRPAFFGEPAPCCLCLAWRRLLAEMLTTGPGLFIGCVLVGLVLLGGFYVALPQ